MDDKNSADKKLRFDMSGPWPNESDHTDFSAPFLENHTDTLGLEGDAPDSRWAERAFFDGFNGSSEAKKRPKLLQSKPPDERCQELANAKELHIDDWIELIGIGVGLHESYEVGDERITFRKWDNEYISSSPVAWQIEMKRDNRTAPYLELPCTPVELLVFIDTAIGIHCFIAPDAFRNAVENLINDKPSTVEVATAGATESGEQKSSDGTQESWVEQVRAIALEFLAMHKAKNLFPSQSDVCEHVESVARTKKIYGHHGKPISQSYIQRNAIQGDWWRKNKP